MPGTSGETHCGRWTNLLPEGVEGTRLVCNQPAGHRGKHRSGWSRCEWADGQEATRVVKGELGITERTEGNHGQDR